MLDERQDMLTGLIAACDAIPWYWDDCESLRDDLQTEIALEMVNYMIDCTPGLTDG